jgi:transposase
VKVLFRVNDVVSSEDRELARENERLRRENRILKEERDILKNRDGPQPACARYKQPVLLLAA